LSNSSRRFSLPQPKARQEGGVMRPLRVPQERSDEDCLSSGCMSPPSSPSHSAPIRTRT
jgi:hypothetical protein